MTTIRYFIPEDGDTEQHPNVFLARKPRQSGLPPLLGDIKSCFPLPGTYHFRFKTSVVPGGELYGSKGNDMAVWMDCVDDRKPVPVWRNSIVAKLIRISTDDEEDDEDFHQHTNNTNAQRNMNGHSHHNVNPTPDSTANLLNVFDHTPAPAPAPQPPSQQHQQQQQQQHSQAPPPPQSHAPTSSATPLFDMNVLGETNTVHTSSTGSLLDMDAPPTHTNSATTPSASTATSDFFNAPASAPPHHSSRPLAPHTNELLNMGMHPMPPTQQHHGPPPPQHQQQPPQPLHHGHVPRGVTSPAARMTAPMNTIPRDRQRSEPLSSSGHRKQQQTNGSVFDSFSQKQGPFGGLNWE